MHKSQSLKNIPLLILLLTSCGEKMELRTFNAMAPLHVMHYQNSSIEEVADWNLFRRQLKESKKMGIDGISVDVWWGMVEKDGDNIFHWEYYQKIFSEIISNGLEIIPILSFHSFDPGPNSAFRAPIPNWVWKYLAEKSGLNEIDLKYISEEKGKDDALLYSDEFVSLWADEWVMPQYSEFMEEFLREFQNDLDSFQEINISCGPTGELRYPSYSSHDGGSYPNRGRMQCFSKPAIQNYREYLKADSFIHPSELISELEKGNYSDHGVERLLKWYNLSLMNHGNRMLKECIRIFPETIPIGFKIPGIHWKIADPKTPRIAEITCGLIDGTEMNGEGAYSNSLRMVLKDLPLERIILHFTCLEQNNSDLNSDSVKHFSRAKDLVYDVSSASKNIGIKIKGENSLSKNLRHEEAWFRIQSAIEHGNYSGLTIMRLNDVTFGNNLGNQEYSRIIRQF